ncbi:MAG: CAP domain-containing protein [Thermoanaerobaculia bacterium]
MRLLLFLLLAAIFPAAVRGDVRQELLQLVNRERQAAGSPPLRLSPALGQVAQWHAGLIARRGGSLRLPASTAEALHERIRRAGYGAHEWTESLQSSNQDVETMVHHWRKSDPDTFRKLLDPQFRDLGLGAGTLDGVPLYVFLYAVPEAEHFGQETRGLGDLDRVRSEMLAAVNAERKRHGAPPLTANARLDQAAQRHAADMLARNYFSHGSPEGRTVSERAKDAGYDWRAIGENIAEGQTSIAEVMKTWMNSPGHRHNILDRDFRELGAGLALGRNKAGYKVEWVQVFGARR